MLNQRSEREKEKKDDIRVGYQVASNLWICENKIYWSRFNTLIVANSILLVTIGWFFSNKLGDDEAFLNIFSSMVIPIVGIILCIFWFLMSYRGSVYQKYWIFSTRELEEKYLVNVVTSSRGGGLTEGKEVRFDFENSEPKIVKMPWFCKFRVEWSSYMIIGLFAFVYLIILIKGVFFSGDDNLWYIFNRIGGEMQLGNYSFYILLGITSIFGGAGIFIIRRSICKIVKECEVRKLEGYKTISVLGGIITIVSILVLAYIAYLRS
jgi:hypothetical protein